MKKKILSVIMFSIMIISNVIEPVLAMEQEIIENNSDTLTAFKETVKIEDKIGEYDVKISVPGKEGVELHDEVILMVDGSYSLDEEWPAMKEAIIAIGNAFLNGNGNTQLTLMAFGMGDNEVLTHVKTVEELTKSLGELPGTLLYGRSSTNCEAGFTGVAEYIINHDETLNDVHVVYISDGKINTDETPHTFYNWKENTWLKRSPEVIAAMALEIECEFILMGGNKSEAFKTIFGEEVEVQTLLETATSEQILAWADLVWDNVYEEANFIKENAYAVSDAERIFVAYDEKYSTHIQEAFYYALWGRSYPNSWTRTPKAANELAKMEEIKSLYLVDYDNYSAWMDTGITEEKSEFIQSNGINGLLTALEGVITNLSSTSYSNAIITDYTSKWINPVDINNDGIFDEKDISVTNKGQQVENVKIEVINLTNISEETLNSLPISEQQEIREILENDSNLKDNSNGSIYRIKWFVKEGMLKASDHYTLSYRVKVDTEEYGYISGNENYKANGEVKLVYDKSSSDNENPGTVTKKETGIVIKEDPVEQKENIITITKTDEEGNLLKGADFEISTENQSNNTIVKEYSINGKDWYLWDINNPNYDASYFRFSGLYNYIYRLQEIKTPDWYTKMEEKTYNFTNLEGQLIQETIINNSIKGKVIVHYVVKIGDDYISLYEFATDENGNKLADFKDINIDDIILTGRIETTFETSYQEIPGLTLNGLYLGDLIKNNNLNKLQNNQIMGTFEENIQEYTYLFELNIGNGEEIPLPPQTGYEINFNYIYTIIMLCFISLFIKKTIY